MGKWRVFALRAASSLIWGGWGFAFPFYFVQDCSKNRTSCVHYFTNKLTTLTWHCGEVALAKLGLTKSWNGLRSLVVNAIIAKAALIVFKVAQNEVSPPWWISLSRVILMDVNWISYFFFGWPLYKSNLEAGTWRTKGELFWTWVLFFSGFDFTRRCWITSDRMQKQLLSKETHQSGCIQNDLVLHKLFEDAIAVLRLAGGDDNSAVKKSYIIWDIALRFPWSCEAGTSKPIGEILALLVRCLKSARRGLTPPPPPFLLPSRIKTIVANR